MSQQQVSNLLLPVSKVKQMIQEHPDVGRLRQSELHWMTKSSELFVQTLLDESQKAPTPAAEPTSASMITLANLQHLVLTQPERFSFLQGVLDDLREQKQQASKPSAQLTSQASKKRKRQDPTVSDKFNDDILIQAAQVGEHHTTDSPCPSGQVIVPDQMDYD